MLIVALSVFLAVAIALLIAFISASSPAPSPREADDPSVYATQVALALGGASATMGEELIERFACSVCHIKAGGRAAPEFAGIAERAAKRRAPLSAAEYLYGSIVNPGAYLADQYANSMPANYAARLTPQEIGHIIAYLLTLSGAGGGD
ncbi:MAG: c-type cytochrome [Chloroflexi bacterium]|nr:c-type cytochrome [Chloroflexota bacterium]